MSAFECLALSALYAINYELIATRNPQSKWAAGSALLAGAGFAVAGLLVVLK